MIEHCCRASEGLAAALEVWLQTQFVKMFSDTFSSWN